MCKSVVPIESGCICEFENLCIKPYGTTCIKGAGCIKDMMRSIFPLPRGRRILTEIFWISIIPNDGTLQFKIKLPQNETDLTDDNMELVVAKNIDSTPTDVYNFKVAASKFETTQYAVVDVKCISSTFSFAVLKIFSE